MTPKSARDIHHAAAIAMVRFDRQSAAVRRILAEAPVNVRVPNRPITVKQAQALARGAARP